MKELHGSARRVLPGGVPPGAEVFVDAVLTQLLRPVGGPVLGDHSSLLAHHLLQVLRVSESGPERAALIAVLLDEPNLLSSIFQNIDLLYEHEFSRADDVSKLVLDSIGAAPGHGTSSAARTGR